MEKIFLEFLNIYFWVFSVIEIIIILYTYTNDYKENKKNAIKNGTFNVKVFNSIIGYTLFILSIILT